MGSNHDSTRIRPNRIQITPLLDEGLLRWAVHLPTKRAPIVFDLTLDDGMRLKAALQHLQARHRIPNPSDLRPSGKSKLSIVSNDD